MKSLRIAVLSLLTLIACEGYAAPTDLDSRWDGDGLVFPSDPRPQHVEGMLLQPDGSVIVALSGPEGQDGVNRVIRLDSAGRVDRTFGVDGRILLSLPGLVGVPPHTPQSLALHTDGRVDVLWVYARPLTPSLTDCSRFLARYLPSGQPDRSFGQDGRVGANTEQSAVCCGGLELDSAGNSYRIERTSYPIGYECVVKDITERKRSDLQIHREKKTTEGILEGLPLATFVIDTPTPHCLLEPGLREAYRLFPGRDGGQLP